MGSINAVPSYTAYYNLPAEGNSGTGIVFAIFQVGQMTGALFSWVSDWHGRRWPIFIGCFGTCIGAVITSIAPTIPAFIGGRFLLSFFSTIATAAAPMYLIEIAPPHQRGTIAGMYNTLYYLVSAFPKICRGVLTTDIRARFLQLRWCTELNNVGVRTVTSWHGGSRYGSR